MKVFIDSNLLIYLNALKTAEKRMEYEDFYLNLLSEFKAYSNVLVLDELIYISKKKYNVPHKITLNFIESIVLPYVYILPLGEQEYLKAADILNSYNVKPSDALHVAGMMLNNIPRIASEDEEFENIKRIERIWL